MAEIKARIERLQEGSGRIFQLTEQFRTHHNSLLGSVRTIPSLFSGQMSQSIVTELEGLSAAFNDIESTLKNFAQFISDTAAEFQRVDEQTAARSQTDISDAPNVNAASGLAAAGVGGLAAAGLAQGGEASVSGNSAGSVAALLNQRIADVTNKNVYPDAANYAECVWYVRNRAKEKLGTNTQIRGNGGTWFSQAASYGFETGNDLRGNAIACFGATSYNKYGHVVFLEEVSDGKVYFTEANVQPPYSDHKISSLDGVLKSCSIEEFKAKNQGKYQGSIYL